jgi:hypothetical protein
LEGRQRSIEDSLDSEIPHLWDETERHSAQIHYHKCIKKMEKTKKRRGKKKKKEEKHTKTKKIKNKNK